MFPSRTYLGVSYRSCFIIFYLINVLLIGGMVATIFIKKWISFDDITDVRFEGGLTKFHDPEDASYEETSDETCDYYDKLKMTESDDIISKFVTNIYDSRCQLVTHLYSGGNLYIGLESGAAGSIFLWTLSMIMYCKFGRGLILSYLLTCIGLISHILAIAIFIVLTNTKLSSSDDFPIDGDQPELCAETGVFVSMAISGPLVFNVFLFILVACKLEKTLGYEGLSKGGQQNNTRIQDISTRKEFNHKEEANQTRVQHINEVKSSGTRNFYKNFK